MLVTTDNEKNVSKYSNTKKEKNNGLQLRLHKYFKPECWKGYVDKHNYINVNKNQTDATECKYLFTAKLRYMFRVSKHPSSGVLKTVPAASGTGHNTGAATPLQRGLIRPHWRGVAVQVV